MTALDPALYQTDGLHFDENAASQMSDVLLNLRCNAVVKGASVKGYPMDNTCCNSYDQPSWTQAAILNVSIFLSPILVLITSRDSNRLTFLPSRRISHAITIYGIGGLLLLSLLSRVLPYVMKNELSLLLLCSTDQLPVYGDLFEHGYWTLEE